MTKQLSHNEISFPNKRIKIKVITDRLQSPSNVGALFRICDAMGVDEIIFCNSEINFSSNRLRKTSRNTHKIVRYTISNTIENTIQKLQSEGYFVLGLEITSNSQPIQTIDVASYPIALIIGNEVSGISETVLAKTDQNVHIEMFGQNSSMNVIQATAIALFELTKL